MKKSLILIIVVIIVLIASWLVILPVEQNSEKEVVFSVEKGQGSRDIGLNLEKQGLIRWSPVFRVYVLTVGMASYLKAGEYILSPSMNMPQIADKLFSGNVIREKITIIEGWSLRDIASYFESKGLFGADEFFELVGSPITGSSSKDFSADFAFLKDKPENLSLEGYLFPDTYEKTSKESMESVVEKMLINFDKKLNSELKGEIEKQGKTIFEIVTMASILEKEVITLEDKKIVSGIFWGKIENGEPLRSCATVAYILGKENWTFDEMRTEIASGTEIDSPYNTYKYKGLPLGPICNPGLESIIAAVYPQESDYWYYLSTREGETIFSKTLDEHNEAKDKYFK
ncbi:MAG TPA: endolytic transglycosylase MltG [Candidatus Paceibacterota bacterium]|nr:endolytic transglycosylase MltG [Candidatus Paceibacterota bacterium]